MPLTPKHRDQTVDFLRGVSILLVLFHHFHLTYRMDQGFFADVFSADLMKRIGRNGNYGVTIFFVISGFLITSTTLARFGDLKHVSLRSFYSFRFARIIPNVALMLFIVLALGAAGLKIFQNDSGTVSLGVTVLSILSFTHNVLMQKFGWFNYCLNTLWSLSVEEVFYIGFPLLCVLLRKRALLLLAWSVFVIIGPLYRAHYAGNDIVALHSYLSCFDGMAIGSIAAVFHKRISLSSTARQIITVAAAVMITAVYFHSGILANAVAGISLVALSTGAILLVKREKEASGLVSRFGKNSYELYLFHIITLALMRTAITREKMTYGLKPIWFAAFLLISALVAELIARFYSEPLNKKIRAFLFSAKRRPNLFDSQTTSASS